MDVIITTVYLSVDINNVVASVVENVLYETNVNGVDGSLTDKVDKNVLVYSKN